MTFGIRIAAIALVLATGCHRATAVGPPGPVVHSAREALALHKSRQPARFKMLHQVAAHYRNDTWVMTGYLLGRSDGAFRVSAAAAVGPRLFDVSWIDGKWESEIHLAQLAGQLDPKDVGRSVRQVFFLECSGDGVARGDTWVYRCPVEDPEADELELTLDARTLAVVSKRLFHVGSEVVTMVFSHPRQFGEEWIATKIGLRHHLGYGLDFALTEYTPGFAFEDSMLPAVAIPGR